MILKRKIIASIMSAAIMFSIIQPGIVLAAETSKSYSEPAETVITVDESETDESMIDVSVDETDPSEDVDTTETSEVPEETEPPVSEPSETEPTETVEPTLPEETTPVPLEAFDQSKTIDGIEVRVIAEPGVFSPGSTLSVQKIDNTTIDEIASIDRSNFIISESILFDITILDADGNEIEPDGDVKVQFYDTRFSDENLEATIYHIENVNEVVELDYTYVDDNGNTTTQASDIIEAETDSFSYYTVEFTYAEKQYVLDGGASVSISTILEAVGLMGTPTSIEVSDTNLLSVSNNSIRALKAFTTEEWIKVTINDVEYTIIVTDEVDDTGVATAGEDLYAVLYDSGKLVFQKGEDAREAYGNIAQSWAVTPSFSSDCPWANYSSSITSIIFNNPTEGIIALNNYFSGCSNLTEVVNIDRLDTSEVTTMGSMFSECSSLTSLDLSSFDTSICTNMSGMFSECSSLTSLDLSTFDFSNVSIYIGMLYDFAGNTLVIPDSFSNINDNGATKLTGNWISGDNAVRGTEIESASAGTYTKVESATLGTNVYGILYEDGTLVVQKGNTPDPARGTVVSSGQASTFTAVGSRAWGAGNAYISTIKKVVFTVECSIDSTGAYGMFSNYSSLEEIDNLFLIDLGNNPYLSDFWSNCSSLEEVDFSQLTFTGNISSIYHALYGCNNLKRIIYISNVSVLSNVNDYVGDNNKNTFYVTASDDPTSAFNFKTVLNTYGDTADVYTVVNKVSFYLNSGSMTGPVVRYANENGLIDGNQFYTPTRTNYTFDGWYDADGNRYEEYPAGEMIDYFYARWTANTYTITFDPNGRFGLDPVVLEVPYDESVSLSDVFADENTGNWYVKNWNTKATGVGTSYSVNYRVCNLAGQEDNITIYAQWSEDIPVNMTIRYINLMTGEEVHDPEQVTVSATKTFTQAGIDFYKTWDYDYVQFVSLTPDLDYAHTQVTETSEAPENGYRYQITVNGQTYYYNYYYNTIQNSTVVNTEMDGAIIYAYVLPKIAIRINFPSEILEYFPDLSFTLDGESYKSGEYIIYAKHSNSIGNARSFEYYNLPANGYGTSNFETEARYMVDNGVFDNSIFGWKGYWCAHTHDHFYTSSEYTGSSNSYSYSYTDYSVDSSYSVYGSSLFDGYVDYYYDLLAYIYIDANGGAATTDLNSYLNDGTLCRYPTYISSGANGYNLTDYNWWANPFKNEPTEEQNNDCGFTGFYRPGYIYAGLWTEPDGGEQVVYEPIGTNYYARKINFLTTPVLYVHWEEEEVPTETVTITFDSQGGSGIEPVVVFKGYTLSSVTNNRLAPTYANKTFIGWYTEPNGQGTALDYSAPINDNITYYAYWVDSTRFTLTYNGNGGQVRWRTNSSNYGATYNARGIYAGPIRHNYIAYLENNMFIGWFTEPDGGIQIKNGDIITPNITTLYAHYTPMIGEVNDDNFVYTYYANWTGFDPYRVIHENQSNATDTLHFRFAVNESSDTLPAGTVRIRIPYALGRDGHANLGNIPIYPTDESSSGMFFSYEEHVFYDDITDEVDYDRSYYEIINVVPLQGGFGIDANISYNTPLYYMYGGDILNSTTYSNGKTHFTDKMVPVLFYIDTNLDGDLETSAEVDLAYEVHHTFELTTSSQVSGVGYMFWQDSWGDRPADADDYMYAVWTGNAALSGQGTQGRAWMDEGSSPDGEFVKYLDTGTTDITITNNNSRQAAGSVLYRYPKALLYVAEDERYTASFTTNINAYTRDAFTRSRSVSNTCDINWRYLSHDEAEFAISRINSKDQKTQRNIAQWDSPGTAQWQIRYRDTAPYSIVTNPDGSRSMDVESMTVSIGQRASDYIYSSGAGQNFSRWFSPSGNIRMTDDEVYFSSICITATAYDATYVDENDNITFAYKTQRAYPLYFDIYVRYIGTDELVFYKTVEITNSGDIYTNLPTGSTPVVEYEVRYNTNGAYYTDFTVKPAVNYNFSANQSRLRNYVISDYNADVTSIFKADFRGRVTDSQGQWTEVSMEYTRDSLGNIAQASPTASATGSLYEYSKVKVNEYELLIVETSNYTEDIPQSSTIRAGAVFSNITTNYSQQKTGITSGTFYFLIPDHVSVSNVQVRSSGSNSTNPTYASGSVLSSEYWTVFYTNNWNNSGYTLMQIDIAQPYTDRNLVAVSFNMTRTFGEVEQWGHLDTLRGMFYNTSDTLINEPTSRTYTYANARSIAAAFNGIYNNSMESRTLFDDASIAFKQPAATAWGIFSNVTNSADLPSDHAYVFPGEDYTYRIIYNQSEDKRAYRLRFEDQLDGMGYLTAVEAPVLSGVDELGNETTCTPIIWYSTNENPDYEHIDTEHGWTTNKPENVIVYGLSIDYTTADNGNEFRLPGQRLIDITLRMHNGSYFEAIEHTNTAIAYTADYTSVDPDTITTMNTTTTVTLELPDLTVAKSSNPESGTEAEPALVLFESDITYTISVTNNEDRQIQNVVIRDILDQNLTYNVSGITIGGMTLDQSVKADLLTNDNNLLEIKIHSLEAGETLNIQIKTSIASAHGSDPSTGRCVVTNEAYLVAYNDVRLEKQAKYTSNMTYHEFYVFPDATGLNIEVTAYIAVFTLCACLYVVSKRKKHRYSR